MSTAHEKRYPNLLPCSWFLALSALAAAPLQAAWETVPEIDLFASTNDNPRLRDADVEDSSTSAELRARATLRSFGERGSFYVRPEISTSSYADRDDSNLDRTNYYLRTFGEYRWPNTTIGFDTDFRHEGIRTAELIEVVPEDPEVPDPVDVESGRLISLQEDRERFTVAPYVSFRLSERSALRLGAQYYDIAYTGFESLDTGRTDFTQTQFSVGFVRNVDERNNVTAEFFAGEYEADATNNLTDTAGVRGVFSRALSELWNLNLTTGVQRSEYSISIEDELLENADTRFVVDLGLRKRTERTTLNVNLRRLVNPNSSGFLVERNDLGVYIRQAAAPRVSLIGGLRYGETSGIGDRDQRSARDYVSARFGVEWALGRKTFLEFRYDFRSQEFRNTGDQTANELSVGFRYRGLSRQQN